MAQHLSVAHLTLTYDLLFIDFLFKTAGTILKSTVSQIRLQSMYVYGLLIVQTVLFFIKNLILMISWCKILLLVLFIFFRNDYVGT